ncbi:hydantoinase/oxoprolinase family protein [Roseomonas hellenica]|uniref:Hydantoinase/oxoprolinase family protein n=1 Tax=Plastoroseomonas hellenica TaxID=2687306 RepID=A0ABS5F2E8_9PROT|nr:hydantoinase/oxoprolinase family protein [Plastoroseomonas hellenica]MBR0666691.1 hydantoinase/oxoprolinase family protein [Plastoroseomonas hellenica]
MRYWIGIDTGGTFTDVVLAEMATGRHRFLKVPSNPADPAEAVLRGLDEILAEEGATGAEVGAIALGTTLATNAVLEGKTGRAALLATAGFADLLDLGRQRRPHLYNLDIAKPRPAVAERDRIEVRERLDAAGAVVLALDEAALEAALRGIDAGVQAVAICLLHSYRNPIHEERAAALLRRVRPGVHVCLSSEISPEFREYERSATTAVNAALMPVMHGYLARFRDGMRARGLRGEPVVMQSSGGLVSTATLQRRPVNTFLSGPAGGVIGAAMVGEAAGITDLVTFDIGGTSTDVCLVKAGRPARSGLQEMAGQPVRAACIDLHTIGAGGGSLAWVDAGGLPKVGPQSAGSVPGPACYGKGGSRPTVTDANMVLGRLNSVALLDGRMPVFPDRARAAIEQHMAAPLGMDVVRAAAGILEIANVNMTGAVRVISVEKGEDPRRCALFAFGGGGPLHAAEVAEAMGMRRVLVPAHPGLMSAIGLLAADIRGDFGLTCLAPAGPEGLPQVRAAFADLGARRDAWAAAEGVDAAALRIEHALDLRYRGQSSELVLPLSAVPDAAGLAACVEVFHRQHADRFGYAMPHRAVEVVTARLVAVAARQAPPVERSASASEPPPPAHREVWFRATGFVRTPVLHRATLGPGAVVAGPAVIEQMDTTTIVPPGWTARADAQGNLLLDHDAGEPA